MMLQTNNDSGRVLPLFLIVISFAVLIFVVATPSIDDIAEEERCEKVLGLIEKVAVGCRKHHADTGRPALEYAPKSEVDEFSAKRYHQLSAPQLYKGWQGPYIGLGLSRADNPWGGSVQLRDNLSTHPALGFQLAGGELAEERGQYITFTQVPEDAARLIDARLDGAESSSAWAATGRVEYVVDDGGTLSIYILKSGD